MPEEIANPLPEDRCVIVVTGPIGYGKSRFIRRHLLPALHKQQRKIALLEHRFSSEFGQHARQPPKELAFKEATANVFDFGGGCVCCSPRGDVERGRGGAFSPPKSTLDARVQATGVADPLVFAGGLGHLTRGKLSGVVCLAKKSTLYAASTLKGN